MGANASGVAPPGRPGYLSASGPEHMRQCESVTVGRAAYLRRHTLPLHVSALALRRRARVQRGARHRGDGRDAARLARAAPGAVRDPGGGQRQRGRDSRPPRAASRRRACAAAPQRAQPRQGLLDAARDARGARRAAPALRRGLQRLPALPAEDARADRGRRRGGGLAARAGRGARPAPAAAPAHHGAQLPAALPRAAARADDRPLLRLQALARRRRGGGLLAHAARGLDLRRRGAGDGACPRLPAPRDRDRVDRPRRLARADVEGARAGGARADLRRAGTCAARRGAVSSAARTPPR